MTDSTTTRRSFLGAGALLAAGAIALPGIALAAPLPGSPVPAPLAGGNDATLAARIAALLDAPNQGYFGAGVPEKDCQCARCRALRHHDYECAACGYVGPWLVDACVCVKAKADNMACYQRMIDNGEPFTHYDRQDYAETLAMRDTMCKAHSDPDVRERLRNYGPPYCCHGALSCPTCGCADDSDKASVSGEMLADTLRKVRAVLYSATD